MTTFVDRFRSDFNFDAEMVTSGIFQGDILWRNHSGENVLWLMNNNRPSSIAALPSVTPDWHVKATANFDGDFGHEGILWQNDNGALALWEVNETATVDAIHVLPNPGPTWHVVGDNDFNGDELDDILFQHDSGTLAIWTLNPATGTGRGHVRRYPESGSDLARGGDRRYGQHSCARR